MRRPSPSLVISVIALFVALGGTGYAAFKLPKNSVKGRNIAKGAVHSSDVANGSLKSSDFKKPPKGPKGDKGDKGAAGAPGANGSALAWARTKTDGSVIDGSGLAFLGRGSVFKVYCYDRSGGGVRAVVATVDAGSKDEGAIEDPLPIQLDVTTSQKRIGEVGCPGGTDFFVVADALKAGTQANEARSVDSSFYVAVIA